MYFEDNQTIHSKLNQNLHNLRKQNIDLNEDIQKWKKEILKMVKN